MTTAQIQISYGDGRVEKRRLDAGVYVLGREAGDIVLGDPACSALHAELAVTHSGVTVTDLQSTNGTYAEGVRITAPHRLERNQAIQIGYITLRLLSMGQRTQPQPALPAPNPEPTPRGMTPSNAGNEASTVKSCPQCRQPLDRGVDACTACGTAARPHGFSVFISHVGEDTIPALRLCYYLQQHGFTAWCYELDALPGYAHTDQTHWAVDNADAFVLLLSRHCVNSHHVTAELVRAQGARKAVIPLRHDISHEEVARRRPEWIERLGASVSLDVTVLEHSIDRLVQALHQHQVRSSLFGPDWGTRRLGRIWNELARLVPRAPHTPQPQQPVPGTGPAQPDNGGGQLTHFPHAAGRIDQVAFYLKTLLEQNELEVQVIDHGHVKVVQGRSPERGDWTDAFKKGFGLQQAVSIKLQTHGADLLLEVGNGAWMDKAVGGAVGMLVFWPAAFTAGWGAYKQSELLKRIPLDVRRLLTAE